MLNVSQLHVAYGQSEVLHGLDFAVEANEIVAIMGRNGMGKTTLVNTIVGVTRWRGGTIGLAGRDITKLRPDQRAHQEFRDQ